MKGLVEYLVKSLVTQPDEVLLAARENENTIFMELKVHPDDMGRIIGKDGSTINAIRTVLQAAAASHKKRARLEVLS
jgi:predicted RNA-binding protein YlqC (UPF0109 family)